MDKLFYVVPALGIVGLLRWRDWALAACLLPWAAFTLWAAAPQILASLKGLESR